MLVDNLAASRSVEIHDVITRVLFDHDDSKERMIVDSIQGFLIETLPKGMYDGCISRLYGEKSHVSRETCCLHNDIGLVLC